MMDLSLDVVRDVKIYQRVGGYRFSCDALLLTDFVGVKYPRRIADLGAGSGIIGIVLARRFADSHVELIEVQEEPAALCVKNIAINELSDRVTVANIDIRDVSKHMQANTFDLVVSNPPFRKVGTGKLNPFEEKAIARHEVILTLPELVQAAFYLLRGKGRFCFIHHPGRFIEVIDVLARHRFSVATVRFIHPDVNSGAVMVLIEAVKEGNSQLLIQSPLLLGT
ncbi:MAG: methyltransferase [Nitrospirae bacterium]|nr:methyltransferase [Nitrospirota bacterium]